MASEPVPNSCKKGLIVPIVTVLQPVKINIGSKTIPQKQSTVHLVVRQDSNRSLSTRVREACDKGKSTFYSMTGIGVRPCGLIPDTSVDLYRKVVDLRVWDSSWTVSEMQGYWAVRIWVKGWEGMNLEIGNMGENLSGRYKIINRACIFALKFWGYFILPEAI